MALFSKPSYMPPTGRDPEFIGKVMTHMEGGDVPEFTTCAILAEWFNQRRYGPITEVLSLSRQKGAQKPVDADNEFTKALALTYRGAAAAKSGGKRGKEEVADIFAEAVVGYLMGQRQPMKELDSVHAAIAHIDEVAGQAPGEELMAFGGTGKPMLPRKVLTGFTVNKLDVSMKVTSAWMAHAQKERGSASVGIGDGRVEGRRLIGTSTAVAGAEKLPEYEYPPLTEDAVKRLADAGLYSSVDVLASKFHMEGDRFMTPHYERYLAKAVEKGVVADFIVILKNTCHKLEEDKVFTDGPILFATIAEELTTQHPTAETFKEALKQAGKRDYFIARTCAKLLLPEGFAEGIDAYVGKDAEIKDYGGLFLSAFPTEEGRNPSDNLVYLIVALGDRALEATHERTGSLSVELEEMVRPAVESQETSDHVIKALADVSGFGCVFRQVSDNLLFRKAGMTVSEINGVVAAGTPFSVEFLQRASEMGIMPELYARTCEMAVTHTSARGPNAAVDVLHRIYSPVFAAEADFKVKDAVYTAVEARSDEPIAKALLAKFGQARGQMEKQRRDYIVGELLVSVDKDRLTSFQGRMLLRYRVEEIRYNREMISQAAKFILTGDPLADDATVAKESRTQSKNYHPDRLRDWELGERVQKVVNDLRDAVNGKNLDTFPDTLKTMHTLSDEGLTPTELEPPKPSLTAQLTEALKDIGGKPAADAQKIIADALMKVAEAIDEIRKPKKKPQPQKAT